MAFSKARTTLETRLQAALSRRTAEQRLRRLPPPLNPAAVDFSSNDYLGLSRHPAIVQAQLDCLHALAADNQPVGGTGARLLTGNHPALEALEQHVADVHGTEAALLFGSGYEANSGLLATLPARHDIVCYDELCHASLREGLRLCAARSFRFRHNDLDHLTQLLDQHTSAITQSGGQFYIVTESVFSMDGDTAPLSAIARLCHAHQALLIVDEAHGLGIVGPNGWGLSQSPEVAAVCAARVYTYGKAAGVQGAAVLGTKTLRDYLLNFCSGFIYTTAPGPAFAVAIRAAYGVLATAEAPVLRERLLAVRSAFVAKAKSLEINILGANAHTPTAILCVPIGGAEPCKAAAAALQAAGYDVRPILSPTVAEGAERLRFCLHAFNTPEQAQAVVHELYKALLKLV